MVAERETSDLAVTRPSVVHPAVSHCNNSVVPQPSKLQISNAHLASQGCQFTHVAKIKLSISRLISSTRANVLSNNFM